MNTEQYKTNEEILIINSPNVDRISVMIGSGGEGNSNQAKPSVDSRYEITIEELENESVKERYFNVYDPFGNLAYSLGASYKILAIMNDAVYLEFNENNRVYKKVLKIGQTHTLYINNISYDTYGIATIEVKGK